MLLLSAGAVLLFLMVLDAKGKVRQLYLQSTFHYKETQRAFKKRQKHQAYTMQWYNNDNINNNNNNNKE